MALIVKRIDFDPEFQPVSAVPVIKREILSALSEAQEIIRRARVDADRIRREAEVVYDQAVQELESEKQRGYQEGHETGAGQWTEKYLQLAQEKEDFFQEAEPQMIRMVMDISEKVIGRALEQGAIVDVVRQAISQSTGQRISVRVNPADRQALLSTGSADEILASAFHSNLKHGQTLSFKDDEGISRGGCIVETEMGSVDAKLETQLGAIRRALGIVPPTDLP